MRLKLLKCIQILSVTKYPACDLQPRDTARKTQRVALGQNVHRTDLGKQIIKFEKKCP